MFIVLYGMTTFVCLSKSQQDNYQKHDFPLHWKRTFYHSPTLKTNILPLPYTENEHSTTELSKQGISAYVLLVFFFKLTSTYQDES